MPDFRISYLEPKFRTIQASDLNDAQKIARMMMADQNDGREHPVVMTTIEAIAVPCSQSPIPPALPTADEPSVA